MIAFLLVFICSICVLNATQCLFVPEGSVVYGGPTNCNNETLTEPAAVGLCDMHSIATENGHYDHDSSIIKCNHDDICSLEVYKTDRCDAYGSSYLVKNCSIDLSGVVFPFECIGGTSSWYPTSNCDGKYIQKM
eukprot:97152_1